MYYASKPSRLPIFSYGYIFSGNLVFSVWRQDNETNNIVLLNSSISLCKGDSARKWNGEPEGKKLLTLEIW